MKKYLLILLLIALAIPANAAEIQAVVTARTAVTVEKPAITLGDIFEGVPADKAALAIGNAPEFGKKSLLTAEFLAAITQKYNLAANLESSGFITVERAGKRIGKEELIKAVRPELASYGVDGETDIAIDTKLPEIFADPAQPTAIIFTNVNYDASRGSFTADATVEKSKLTLHGRIVTSISIPVANRAIRPGEVIAEADIAWINFEANKLGYKALTQMQDIVGKRAERPINPNTIIRSSMLAAPILVKKNSVITITYISPIMTITNQVRATEDGSMGDTIRVLNTQSNKMVDAIVTGSDQVTAATGAVLAAR